MTNESTQKLAERIALLLQQETEKPKDDFSALQATLEKINQRLDKIETQIAVQNSNPQSRIPNLKLFHPSQEKFAVDEAIIPEMPERFEKEKACTFEPNGKPCDHCAMCSARGF
jgi:organic radical activating enzyme